MALYSYTCDDCGNTEEKFGTFDDHPKWVHCTACGCRALRDIAADCVGIPPESCRRMESEALGAIQPEEVPQIRKFFKERGVGDVEFNPETLCPVFRGRQQFYKARRAANVIDRNGFTR